MTSDSIVNSKEIIIMPLSFVLISFCLLSLTVSATPSLHHNASLMSEPTVKNQMKFKFDKAQESNRMDEILSKFSVTNAATTQDIASGYLVGGIYVDATCSTLTYANVNPLGVCLSVNRQIYTYSSVDKKYTVTTYEGLKCKGAVITSGSAFLSEMCSPHGGDGMYIKYSFISSISALNTDGFLEE
jgi:hypothetical protein